MATLKEEETKLEVLASKPKPKAVRSQFMNRGEENEALDFKEEIDWDTANDYEVYNENGSKLLFGEIIGEYKTIVVFIRHFLCFAAKDYVEDLAQISRGALNKAKIRLVIIGCGDHKFMKQFRRDTGYWAEFYTDPDRELYKVMGCKDKGDFGDLSHSKHVKTGAVTGVIKSAWRSANFPGEWQGDINQQGGAFILGPGSICHFAHADKNASDHCPINKLLDLVEVENVRFERDKGIQIV